MVVDNLEPCAAKTKLRIRLDKTLQHIANMLAHPQHIANMLAHPQHIANMLEHPPRT